MIYPKHERQLVGIICSERTRVDQGALCPIQLVPQ